MAYFTNIGLLLRVPGGGSNRDLILSIITIERMETKLVSICVSEDGGGGITDQKCMVQQTLNITVMVGLVRKQFSVGLVARLRCWPRPPGRNFHFWLQSWDEIATLYCRT